MPACLHAGKSCTVFARSSTTHRRHCRDARCRRLSLTVRADTLKTKEIQQFPPQAQSNGNGNGAGNGKSKTLISSNNGVLLDRKGASLEDRISSGEFSDQGSTKEKLLRPVRQALAKDPFGPGMCFTHLLRLLPLCCIRYRCWPLQRWRCACAMQLRCPIPQTDIKYIGVVQAEQSPCG